MDEVAVMYYRGHLFVGLLTGLFFVFFSGLFTRWFVFDLFSVLFFFSVVFIGSLVVDVDHNKSFVGLHRGFFVAFCVGVCSLVVSLVVLGVLGVAWLGLGCLWFGFLLLIAVFSGVSRQRGFLHSLFFCLIFGLFVGLLSWSVGFGFLGFFVCCAHLLADGVVL